MLYSFNNLNFSITSLRLLNLYINLYRDISLFTNKSINIYLFVRCINMRNKVIQNSSVDKK